MPSRLIRANPANAAPVVDLDSGVLSRSVFQLLRLGANESVRLNFPGCESLVVVLSGQVDVRVGDVRFDGVGRRRNIWEGPADSVYAGTGAPITIVARMSGAEVAVAGGLCAPAFAPFRILPEAVSMVEVGSVETHARRRIFHILGQNANGRAGNLLVSELYADGGCWSGYPPHKHDTERPPEETAFEEIYHYRFRPESGFGAQYCYEAGSESPEVVMTRHGDTFMVDRGYHPTVASPGHDGYIFTVLVGHHQRSLVQSFDPVHAHLMDRIPGIQAMRDRFK